MVLLVLVDSAHVVLAHPLDSMTPTPGVNGLELNAGVFVKGRY